MARVTVEDCIDKVENRFELVLLASHRARMISSGAPLTIDRDRDKNPVVALREVADKLIARVERGRSGAWNARRRRWHSGGGTRRGARGVTIRGKRCHARRAAPEAFYVHPRRSTGSHVNALFTAGRTTDTARSTPHECSTGGYDVRAASETT